MKKSKEKTPYSRFDKEELALRDLLALDRTILSNERNLLAYIRTALGFFVAGVTLVHFFVNPFIAVVGWIFIPTGILIFLIGWKRYKTNKKMIEKLKEYEK